MMTNKDWYKQTFLEVKPSTDYLNIVKENKKRHAFYMPSAVVACLILLFIIGVPYTAYATNIGNIQQKIQVWIHGNNTSSSLHIHRNAHSSDYDLTYQDASGNTVTEHGSLSHQSDDGALSPASPEEIQENMNENIDIVYYDKKARIISETDDINKISKVMLYYKEQSIDITDKFDEDFMCYITLHDGEEKIYVTIRYGGAYTWGDDGYASPDDVGEPYVNILEQQ